MAYKGGTYHRYVPDEVRMEILDMGDKARDDYEAGRAPFNNKDFYDGYKKALQELYDFCIVPMSGPM